MSSQILQPPTLIMTKLSNGYLNDEEQRASQYCKDDKGESSMTNNVPEASSLPDRSCNENLEETITISGSDVSKQNITPRTSSLATLLSIGCDEQFHIDSDDGRSESIMSMNSISGSRLDSTNVLDTLPTLTKVVDDNGTSPNSCRYMEESYQNEEGRGHLPQQDANSLVLSLEPGLSLDSESMMGSLSSPYTPLLPPPQLPTTPSYEMPGSRYISPNEYQVSSGRRSRKAHPLVYSAIGSLESVNQSNLGSFNSKYILAAATKRKGKEKQVKVNATTSHISKRITKGGNPTDTIVGRGTQKKSTMDGNVQITNSTFKFSDLSSKISSRPTDSADSTQKVSALSSTLSSKLSCQENAHVETTSKSPAQDNLAKDDLENQSNRHVGIEVKSSPRSKKKGKRKKKVTIDSKPKEMRHVELFRPSCDAYTPRMGKKVIKYKPAEERACMEEMSTKMGTIQRPNFKDALRRVAMIIQQHIVKIEKRFEDGADHLNLFSPEMRDAFDESNFVTPRYKCTITKLPMARAGVVYGMRKIRLEHKIPTAEDIYQFAHRLFKQVQLSSECSIICLIYVERLMETAKVPVMAKTWKPIFMCGLLLASKVWQDWSSWNIEFASVYPSYSLEAINKLELQFLKMVKWDLYISSSLYAKYYFALRSLLEKQDFRRKYVRMVGGIDNVSASEALKVSKRSEMLKEKSLAYLSLSV